MSIMHSNLEEFIVKKMIIASLSSLLLLSSSINTVVHVHAHEIDADTEDIIQETQTEQVVVYEDENKKITADVPSEMKDQYLRDLQDPTVVEQELAKASRSLQARSSDSSVYYWGEDEVVAMANNLRGDNSFGKALVAGATADAINMLVKVFTGSGIMGGIATAIGIGANIIQTRQKDWWQESAILILRGKINAVKITITPNPGPGYPQIYRTVERV